MDKEKSRDKKTTANQIALKGGVKKQLKTGKLAWFTEKAVRHSDALPYFSQLVKCLFSIPGEDMRCIL